MLCRQVWNSPGAFFGLITHGRLLTAKQRKPKRAKNSQEIYSIAELQPGDYVVHASHGIGVFEGIHKIDMHGVVKDYIKLKYAQGGHPSMSRSQLDMVCTLVARDASVKLNRLGGTEWQKTKARVRTAVKDMAKELIKLYADRYAGQRACLLPGQRMAARL